MSTLNFLDLISIVWIMKMRIEKYVFRFLIMKFSSNCMIFLTRSKKIFFPIEGGDFLFNCLIRQVPLYPCFQYTSFRREQNTFPLWEVSFTPHRVRCRQVSKRYPGNQSADYWTKRLVWIFGLSTDHQLTARFELRAVDTFFEYKEVWSNTFLWVCDPFKTYEYVLDSSDTSRFSTGTCC